MFEGIEKILSFCLIILIILNAYKISVSQAKNPLKSPLSLLLS